MIRTQRQAYTEARKRWGDDAMIQYNRKALVGAAKHEAHRAVREHRSREPKEPPGRKERTPEFLAWVEARRSWKKELDRLMGLALSARCSVGHVFRVPGLGAGFGVQGHGDSWDEAFKQVDR